MAENSNYSGSNSNNNSDNSNNNNNNSNLNNHNSGTENLMTAAQSAKKAKSSRNAVVAGMLSAIAFILMFIEIPVPMLIPSFIKMDISDLPALLGSFALGPVYGIVISLLKNILIMIIKGSSSAGVGELSNFILGAVFTFLAGLIYKRHKNIRGAIAGAVIGAAAMAAMSLPSNYFIVYPAYVKFYGLPMDVIVGMYQVILPYADSLLKCLVIFNIPFTFVKGMIDVAICFLIYKPLSPILHGRNS